LPPVDLEFSNSLDKGGFDVIVAVFTLQDCDRLDNPLELIRNSLAPHGRALIVLENDAAFEGEGRHITTSRKPLDGESQAGAGRRWLIFWDSHFPALAQSDTRSVRDQSQLAADPNFKPRVTITRHWSIESYLETAAAKKLEPAKEAEELHVSGPADSYLLQRYELKPKFSLLTLRRREDIPEHRVKPLPLILIAGASGTGKTALARHMALQDAQVVVVNLDDFYLDEEAARRIMAGEMPDWESSRNIDLRAAARAVDALVRREEADIPIYDMARSAVDGQRTVSAANARVIVVEGLFAFKLFAPSANQITRVVLEGSWLRLCYRRLKRDAAEKRRRLWPSMVLSLRLGWQNRVRRKTNRQMANYTYPCALPAAELATRIRKDAGLLP
jgi:uridine kinase